MNIYSTEAEVVFRSVSSANFAVLPSPHPFFFTPTPAFLGPLILYVMFVLFFSLNGLYAFPIIGDWEGLLPCTLVS